MKTSDSADVSIQESSVLHEVDTDYSDGPGRLPLVCQIYLAKGWSYSNEDTLKFLLDMSMIANPAVTPLFTASDNFLDDVEHILQTCEGLMYVRYVNGMFAVGGRARSDYKSTIKKISSKLTTLFNSSYLAGKYFLYIAIAVT